MEVKQEDSHEDEAVTIPAKYVFLDVVDFSRDRSVEAQSYIVQALNKIVLISLRKNSIPDEKRLLLPTGDGICIALLNITEPYDIHIQLALSIVKYIDRFQGSSHATSRISTPTSQRLRRCMLKATQKIWEIVE